MAVRLSLLFNNDRAQVDSERRPALGRQALYLPRRELDQGLRLQGLGRHL